MPKVFENVTLHNDAGEGDFAVSKIVGCPFCGRAPTGGYAECTTREDEFFSAICCECKALGPQALSTVSMLDAVEKSAAAWNRRAVTRPAVPTAGGAQP